jgi:diacylglycerol kinase family enzyme
MAMEAVIIGNPNSGSAGDEGYLGCFAEALRAGGLEVEVLNTERPDTTPRSFPAAAGDRLVVVAAGGDGTVNEVLSTACRRAPPWASCRWARPTSWRGS